ncbi:MAG: PEP-utilizing enzyme [Acidimicrobiia bacterium]
MDRWITDWPINPDYPLFTRANAGEVLPDPASPLAWTLVWEPGALQGWADSALLDYRSVDPGELSADRPEVVGSFGGYLYICATAVRIFAVRGPGLTPEAIDYVYFGEHPDVPPYVPEPWHENAAATARMGEWMASVLAAEDLPDLRVDRDEADRIRAERPDLAKLSDEALLERARSLVPVVRQFFRRHLAITAAASIGPGILAGIAGAMGDPAMTMRLVSGVGDVDSAAPSAAMWQLSRLPVDSEDYRARFKDFLVRYGSRGPNEWDIRSDTWETDTKLATVLIDSMRGAADSRSAEARVAERIADREALTAHVTEALAGDAATQAQFLAALRSAHLHLAGRERTKTNVIKVIHEIRVAIHELGGRHGFTPSAVCMLLADELDAFVADPTEFRVRLASREQQYLTLFDLEPPFIVNAVGPPIDEWPRRDSVTVAQVGAGALLNGVPGCPGRATGRARVVLDPSDPRGIESGDVLIAPITDPSWTPLFVAAAAVVVDVGAQVSHAVIVSREFGIPCVVSVQHATRRIPDGAMVTVDGTIGSVEILSVP